jgi:tRNA dimethylallyltransferase
LELIAAIRSRGRVPLLVGGTMLYFRALARGLASLPAADEIVRAQIDAEARERGWPALHAELAVADPGAAERIAPRDRQRIQRALEVLRLTGRRISELQQELQQVEQPGLRRVALVPADRGALYRHLDDRLSRMIGSGFVEEVRGLMALPLMSAQRPSMRAVGYRQLWSCLAGEMTRAEAQAEAAKATRHLAKRQLTWLRSDPADLTLDPAVHGAYERLSDFLAAVGVSRRAKRCNMIDGPIECREHGV